MKRCAQFLLAGMASSVLLGGCQTAGTPTRQLPPLVRVENFTVPPSTGPVTYVASLNPNDGSFEGSVELKGPEGWRIQPPRQSLALKPHERKRVPFTIEKAMDKEANTYLVEVTISGVSSGVTRQQNVVCSSAPRFTAVIDGDSSEWKDAIPVTFETQGKKTVVSTYWDRRHFFLLVEVEEDWLLGYSEGAGDVPIDALQFAISRRSAKTGTTESDKSSRHEFLVASTSQPADSAVCCCLLQPEQKLAVTQQRRSLSDLKLEDAQVVVKRRDGLTLYECAIPFTAIGTLRPVVGREFRFSFVIHDPDGTGVRDWGEATGLWPAERNRFAWCSWAGVRWGELAPYDSKTEWGLCSSKY